MGRSKPFKLFADFGQIHVRDASTVASLESAWTAQASEDRIADGGSIVGVGAKDSADVNVSVEILTSAPSDDASEWEHVSESSIDLTSGEVRVLGCTDEIAKARRFAAGPGTWRVRASHANLARGREQLRLQLWAAPRTPARVVKRWSPPATRAAGPKRIASTKQAVRAAMRGETATALDFLLPRAKKGDFAACASALQILAFRGEWRELVPLALVVIAEEPQAHAWRETTSLACALLQRSATELCDPGIIASAEAKLAASMRKEALPCLQGEVKPSKKPTPEALARFREHASSPETEKRFRDRPDQRAAHLLAYAHLHLGSEEEQLALWNPGNELLRFQEALWIAEILARRGDAQQAWQVLASRLASWWPSTIWAVAPCELLVNASLAPLMSKERCEQILSTPRGDQHAAKA